MANCENGALYNSVNWCPGTPQLGGIQSKIYGASKRDIVTWPTRPIVPADAQSVTKIVTYEGDFVLAADKKFVRIDVLTKKSPMKSASQGEIPNVTSLNTLTAFHPGIDEEASAFLQQAQNDDMVYVYQQKNGKWRVIGAKEWETTTTYEMESDGAQNGNVGSTLTLEATDFGPAPFYVGTLETEDGEIDCSPS